MAVQKDSSSNIIEWGNGKNATVEIVEMRDVDTGDMVKNTTVKKYSYATSNASNLQSELDRLAQLQDRYEDAKSGGGGTSAGGGFGGTGLAIGAVVVVSLAALVYRREQDGSGRGRIRR